MNKQIDVLVARLTDVERQRDALVVLVEEALNSRMIPCTSASEGGAERFSSQVRLADNFRDVIKQIADSKQCPDA